MFLSTSALKYLSFYGDYKVLGKALVYKIILLLILFPSILYGRDRDRLVFHNKDLPLSDYSINDICEDHKGYIWIGTKNGLNKYDGTDVHIYTHKHGDSTGLINNTVKSVFEDSHKRLWIGTNGGLNLYDRDKDNFILYHYSPLISETDVPGNIFFLDVEQVVEDQKGDVWLATQNGICYVDTIKRVFYPFSEHFKKIKNKEATDFVSLVSYGNDLIGGTRNGKLFRLNTETGGVQQLFFENKITVTKPIIHIYKDKQDILRLSTKGDGLIRIDSIIDTNVYCRQFLNDEEDKTSLNSNRVFTTIHYDAGHLLVGLDNGGLDMLNLTTFKSKHFLHDPYDNKSIAGNSVWSLFKDSDKRIWIGVFNHGISLINSKRSAFKVRKNNVCDPHSYNGNPITGFAEDNKGNMWITTDGGGLDYWNRKTDKFRHLKHVAGDMHTPLSDAAICIKKMDNGELWAGFYNGGVFIIGSEGRYFRPLRLDGKIFKKNVLDIEEDKEKIYIATSGAGLFIIDKKNNGENIVHNINKRNSVLPVNVINKLYLDNNGVLWLGLASRGLASMDTRSDGNLDFKYYKHDDREKNSLFDDNVYTISGDSKGRIWVGTGSGLELVDELNGGFRHFNVSDDILGNAVVGILEDDKGFLWISTFNGIFRFDPETGDIKRQGNFPDLPDMRFNTRSSAYRNEKCEMFFGTNHGFVFFDPDSVVDNKKFPPLYFTELKIFNKPMGIDKKGSPLTKHITETKQLILNHKQSVFTLEYSALDFSDNNDIRYAYILDGFETEWNYVGGKRSATYTNLDPGTYIFRVKCTNEDGVWNPASSDIQIVILPPWWRTQWFILTSLLSVLIMIYLIHFWRVRTIRKQKKKLEETVEQRTSELQKVNTHLEEMNEEVNQQKEELLTQAENLILVNDRLVKSEKELELHKKGLEELVKQRTKELEKAKKKAEESDKLKSAFLANMSHEIRTPMNAIVGFAQILMIDNDNEEFVKNYITQINNNAEHLLMLIDDILDISRIESGQITIIKESFYVNSLLEEAYSSALALSGNKSIDIRLKNFKEDLNIKLFSDRYRLKQILMNLLSNAVKFTKRGYVELGFDVKGNDVLFYVRDTGVGIAKKDQSKIFERFIKINNPEDEFYSGTGLGLAISTRLAKLLGGSLSVNSGLNKGSVFTLRLSVDIIDKEI